jgi:DNA repair protein RecO
MIYKAEAIILKANNFSEADKLVILLAKTKGRIQTIAKGSRKATSRKTALIDIAAYADFRIATGKTFDIITEMKLINPFENVKKDIQSAAIIYYLLDVVEKFFSNPEQGEEIFVDLLNALHHIDASEIDQLDNKLKALYLVLVKLLFIAGFLDLSTLNIDESNRIKRIVQFVTKSDFQTSMKLKLNSSDLQLLDQYTHTQISEIVQRKFKTYEFMRSVINI